MTYLQRLLAWVQANSFGGLCRWCKQRECACPLVDMKRSGKLKPVRKTKG